MRCKSENCDRDAWCKGFCAKHYYSAHRHGLLPRPKCSVEGCDQPSFRRGMCNTHHLRWKRHGDPLVRKKAANGEALNAVCSVEACGQVCVGHGLCQHHYDKLRRRGDVQAPALKLPNGTATPERKRENRDRAQKRYAQTSHGKLRQRYAVAKRRVLAGLESAGIPKEAFLALWAQSVCGICGLPVADKEKSIDHIVPLSKGGTNDMSNMQIAHLHCNQVKSNRT